MSSSKEFWNELKKINPANKVIAYSVDNVIGDKAIADKFAEKYKELYSSVPTNDTELRNLHDVLDKTVTYDTSILWHFLWIEAVKPYNGCIYDIMRRI